MDEDAYQKLYDEIVELRGDMITLRAENDELKGQIEGLKSIINQMHEEDKLYE